MKHGSNCAKAFPSSRYSVNQKRNKKKKFHKTHVVVTGCVLHFMLVGQEPFDYTEQMLQQQVSGDIVVLRPTYGHTVSASAKQLIRLILEPDVLKRARIEVIKRSEWMTTAGSTKKDRCRPPLGIARVQPPLGAISGAVWGGWRVWHSLLLLPLMSVHGVITSGRFQNSHIPTRYNIRRKRWRAT